MDREYLAKLCDARDTLCGYCESDECAKCIVADLINDAFNEVDDDFENEDEPDYDCDPFGENKFYGPSNPWDAPGMKISDFI